MDYEEEQRNEIEALESIYPEEMTSKQFWTLFANLQHYRSSKLAIKLTKCLGVRLLDSQYQEI